MVGLNEERRARKGEPQCYARRGMVCVFRYIDRGCEHCGRLRVERR